MKVVGNAAKRDVEFRYSGLRLDEVVAENAHVHLEQMTDSQYALIIETVKERACVWIGSVSNRAEVGANVCWVDRAYRRSEAARRRENRKRHSLKGER